MQFLIIAEDKMINVDNIVSVEKSGKRFKLNTTDGKTHTIEVNADSVLMALQKAGLDCPKQFWAG